VMSKETDCHHGGGGGANYRGQLSAPSATV